MMAALSVEKITPAVAAAAADFYTLVARWILPALAAVICARCLLPLLRGGKRETPWGYLGLPGGGRAPLLHWENAVGRSRLCDVVLNLPMVSRSHAVLTRSGEGWQITDLNSRGGVAVNGRPVEGRAPAEVGDTLSLGGAELVLLPGDARTESATARFLNPLTTLSLILMFQILGGLGLCLNAGMGAHFEIPASFLLFMALEGVCGAVLQHRHASMQIELPAFFLCGLGLFTTASAAPGELYKQIAAIGIGAAAFYAMQPVLKDLTRAQKLRRMLLLAAVLLLGLNLALGRMHNGARNWIALGGLSFQPMELVKPAFALAGAATLDRLLTTRSLTAFIAFSAACVGTLAVIKDFGTALVFFCAFLVIAFMRSGDLRTLALLSAGAALAAFAVVSFLPYVSRRFSAWGHVWQHADTTGYQQTRTMMYAASGGLLGVGGGRGYLAHIAAAGTDLVFGVLCEELGLIVALCALTLIAAWVWFAVASVGRCRSAFYAVAACGAVSMFLMQTALNVFGSFDILPLTGVTLPFVSNGGSSMVTCWCLLGFLKAAAERPAVRENSRRKGAAE